MSAAGMERTLLLTGLCDAMRADGLDWPETENSLRNVKRWVVGLQGVMDAMRAPLGPEPIGEGGVPRPPVELGVIRQWPPGMTERVEHVWRDLVGFTVDYKLYDLKRVLAEFGFDLTVTERTK